jgi:class 3 adenylate cyclase
MEDVQRKLAAILSADVKNYSLLMREDESATVRTLTAYREAMATLIKQHRGRVVDSPGDNLLAEFASVVDAVQSAVAIQKELKAQNAKLPKTRKMEFRIGINLGDIIVEGERIYGDGVNIAARLEGLAEPGGICISRTAYDQIEDKLPLGYEYLGEKTVKNIPKPVRAYRVLLEPQRDIFGGVIKEKWTEHRKRREKREDSFKEEPAGQRPTAKFRFYRHLGAYLAVIAFLLVINILSYQGVLWFYWPALGWGLGLYLHGLKVFKSPSNRFYRHLAAYIGVVGFLLIINILTYSGIIWFHWPALGWGLLLFFHWLSSLFRHPKKSKGSKINGESTESDFDY